MPSGLSEKAYTGMPSGVISEKLLMLVRESSNYTGVCELKKLLTFTPGDSDLTLGSMEKVIVITPRPHYPTAIYNIPPFGGLWHYTK